MSTSSVRSWRFLLLKFVAVSSLLAGIYYTFVLDPYIQNHRIVQRIAARGVKLKFFEDITYRPPIEYGAALILGAEIIDQPYEMYFDKVDVKDDDLVDIGKVTRVWALYLKNQGITNAGLAHLSKLNLLRLDLSGTLVGSGTCHAKGGEHLLKSAFEALANNTRLSELRLTRTNVNDADIAALAKYASPNFLQLGETCITDVGMNEVAFFRDVRWLWLNGTKVTPAGLKKLNASILESLDVSGITMGPEGAVFIQSCTKLTGINLTGTGFTTKDCDSLQGLPSLQQLNLEENPITDDGLETIASIPSLQSVSLLKTQITAEGLEKLSASKTLRLIIIDGDVLADPACVKHLQKLSTLKRVLYSNSPKIGDVVDDVRTHLGTKVDVTELKN